MYDTVRVGMWLFGKTGHVSRTRMVRMLTIMTKVNVEKSAWMLLSIPNIFCLLAKLAAIQIFAVTNRREEQNM